MAGSRYLTERDTTFIVEYYHNGAGYNEEQIGAFYGYVDHISGQVPGPANALESALALAPRIIAVVR